MHCASCASSKKLNKTPGFDAMVNYGSEQASVEFDPQIRTLRDQ